MYETVVPPLDERDFEKTVTPIVQEYFEHGDTNEVAVSATALCRKQPISKHSSLSQNHKSTCKSKCLVYKEPFLRFKN